MQSSSAGSATWKHIEGGASSPITLFFQGASNEAGGTFCGDGSWEVRNMHVKVVPRVTLAKGG